MDCLFNNLIPKSQDNKIILRPTSKTFINGIAQSYDTTFPSQLKDILNEREYSYAINKVVDDLSMMWPCCFCFTYGYLCSLCTLGLSFFFPLCCISEAKIKLLESIQDVNKSVFNKKNISLSYQQKCSTSWLQIDVLDREEGALKSVENANVDLNTNKDGQGYLIKNQLN